MEDIKLERKPTKQKKNQDWVCLILNGNNYVKRPTPKDSLSFTRMLKQKKKTKEIVPRPGGVTMHP